MANKMETITPNNNSETIDSKETNFMADMVEVRVKLYACRVCGIRYDNMEAMKQHYNDVHPTHSAVEEVEPSAPIKITSIKEEIIDDDEEEGRTSYVLVDDDGQHIQLPESLHLGDNQVLRIAKTGENGQFVLQVINQEDVPEENIIGQDDGGEELMVEQPPDDEATDDQIGEIVELRRTRQQTAIANAVVGGVTPPRVTRGRKRKTVLEPKIVEPTVASTRSKRMVVPNIKSEFIYEGLNQSVETETSKQPDSSTYTFIQEGGVITAFHLAEEVQTSTTSSTGNKQKNTVRQQNLVNENELNIDGESYPPNYTPTSRTKKGRQVEPKEDDQHLRRFPCPFQGCKYVAKYRSNLWDHKKTHTGEKPYACNWPSCSMRFSQTHQLKLHLRSHTGERPYVCTWPGCNSAFSQKPGLKSHMLTHTGEKPFKCDFPGCGWTFRLKGALTDHKRAIHENAKKHVCEWPGCNKRFLQQCHLKKHIMGHADIKPFACDWPNCNYKAVTMAYVTNHRKTHTGEKNYECTYPNCNKRFVKSSHVNRHRQRCHPELFVVLQEDLDLNQEESSDEDTEGVVANIQPSGSGEKRRSGIMYKLADQNGADDDDDDDNDDDDDDNEDDDVTEEETIYLQQEDVEAEIGTSEENVQYINGGAMVSDENGQHFIIADTDSATDQQRQGLIELKKEKIDEDVELVAKNITNRTTRNTRSRATAVESSTTGK